MNQIVECLAAIRKLNRQIPDEVEVRDDEIGAQLLVVRGSFRGDFSELAVFAQAHELRKGFARAMTIPTFFVD